MKGEVETTQADREAAAQFVALLPYEEHPLARAFARHRLAATEALRAELAGARKAALEEAAGVAMDEAATDEADGEIWIARRISDRIRALADAQHASTGEG